ncbi:MAG: AbrB/MazE/SpoVT family DNA-binding domain-containing protein [Bacteroidota bacterium]
MTCKIDSSGRVLIPKSIRDANGYKPGTPFNISLDKENRILVLNLVLNRPEPILVIDDLGIPTFDFGTNEVFDYDFTAAINKDREKRN